MAPRFVTKPVMKPEFRLFRRGKTFWCEDTESGRQQSLGTKNKADAVRLLHGRTRLPAETTDAQLDDVVLRWRALPARAPLLRQAAVPGDARGDLVAGLDQVEVADRVVRLLQRVLPALAGPGTLDEMVAKAKTPTGQVLKDVLKPTR